MINFKNLPKNPFLWTLIFVSLVFAFSPGLFAQVVTDFDSDSLEGWRAVGDGQYFLEMGTGNPGNCMRIDDDATGEILIAIAPSKFIGDWSSAGVGDSITADIFLHQLSGTPIVPAWIFHIRGPGGQAQALEGSVYQPTPDIWNHFSVPLDSNFWTVSEGNWNDLISHITLLEVMAEFISGNEYVRLDNITLTFTPTSIPVFPPIYSEFDHNSFEGWTFHNTAGVNIQSSGGNPSGFLQISDAGGMFSEGYAPPGFLGDWSALEGAAAIQLDLKILNKSGPFVINHELIRISGPGGEATVLYDSTMLQADGQWKSFSFLISPTIWELVWGDWNSLLNDITEVVIFPEFIYGSETIGFDNFRLTDDPPQVDFIAQPRYIFLGDSVWFTDQSKFVPENWMWSFGDGNSSMMQNPIHYYTDAGTFDIRLIASNFFGNDSLAKNNYVTIAGISDSILYFDNFNNNSIHPAWRFRNGSWVEQEGQMVQTSNHIGNGTYIDGAFAIVGSKFWDDYTLSTDIKSLDNDRIGFVFRYQDPLNFYLFSWQSEGSARFLMRFVNGAETILASDGVGYNQGQTYHLEMVSDSSRFKIYIDQGLVFDIDDSTFAMGKAGLYCWGNENSFWDNFSVTQTNYVPSQIEPEPIESMKTFVLYQNYPNPFNPKTSISFSLNKSAYINLTIYNVLGEKIINLISDYYPARKHQYQWDITNSPGISSGIYIYKLETEDQLALRKMVLMK